MQDCMMLDRATYDMPALSLQEPSHAENSQVCAFGSAAGEDDFTRFAAHYFCRAVAGVVQNGARLPPHVVNAGRIAKDRTEVRHHRLAHFGIERRSGIVIEINCAHGALYRKG